MRRRPTARAAEHELNELDDRDLRDIGLSRNDIRAAVCGVHDDLVRRARLHGGADRRG